MNLRGYFSNSTEKSLATRLAAELLKELPPQVIEKRLKLLSVNKVTKLLERVYRIAADHQREARIGFIKRAVLANAFKWELKNHNYPEAFIEMATEGLVVAMSKALRPTSAT